MTTARPRLRSLRPRLKLAGDDWAATRVVAYLGVALAVAFGLVTLRSELRPAADLNDLPLHASMVRWAEGRLAAGATPFDGWFPYLGEGFPQFHHYQTLPHLATALLATVLGGDDAVAWVLYLLVATWPISVFLGARLLGWGRTPAAAAAIAAPLLVSEPGYGFELSSYVWQGFGAWTQAWAMWLLPLAWGLTWRAIARGQWTVLAAIVLAATLASHVLTGYLAVLTLALWPLLAPRQLPRRLGRAALVGVGALAASAWLLVPVFTDASFANYAGYERGTFYYDSFGARKVLGWLVSGSLFDEGRFPVVTLLAGVGLVVSVARCGRDERARATVGAFTLSLVLFFGRPTLGPLVGLLPGSDDLYLHRFITGVHLGGLLLAGVGAAALGRGAIVLARRLSIRSPSRIAAAATALMVIVVVLAPAWTERRHYSDVTSQFVAVQQEADAGDGADLRVLIDEVRRRGGGRTYAGTPQNWGRTYKIGYVPVYAELLNHDVDALGFTLRVASLSTAIEALFDETNHGQYREFGIRHLILPAERPPSVPATFVRASGRHRLWQVQGVRGYVDVVDVTTVLSADRTTLAAAVAPWMATPRTATRRPTIAFDGWEAAPVGPGGEGEAGEVTTLSLAPDEGTFAARVRTRRPAVVTLAASFHPRWKVLVDGQGVDSVMIAPSFVGVPVGAGEHLIVFRYEPYPATGPLLLGGVAVLLAVGLGPRVWARRPKASTRLG